MLVKHSSVILCAVFRNGDNDNMSENELKVYAPPQAAVQGAHISGMAAYQKLVAEAQADPSAYWSRLAREFVSWRKPFTKGLDASNAPFFKWFEEIGRAHV